MHEDSELEALLEDHIYQMQKELAGTQEVT